MKKLPKLEYTAEFSELAVKRVKDLALLLTGMANATPDNETCHARSPLSSSLPQAGESDRVSLREFHVKQVVVRIVQVK